MAYSGEEKRNEVNRMLDFTTDTKSRKHSMVNNEFLSDVIFIVGPEEKKIFAHKLILVMSSEYFYIMFCGNFSESNKREIVLVDDDPDIFLEALEYIYSGAIRLSFDNLRELFYCAQKLMLVELTELIRKFIERHIEPDSALRLLTENRHYGFNSVDQKCLQLICNNPLYYFNHEDLPTIDKKSLSMILGAKFINCTEDQLQMTLDIWAASKKERNDIDDLSKLINDVKRSYNCIKLRLFGQHRCEGYMPSDLSFTLDSNTALSLYGIGVFIYSTSTIISVDLKIFQEDVKVGSESFEVANNVINTVHVSNLFFEEIVLEPHHRYKFVLTISPCNEYLGLVDPFVIHEKIKIRFHTLRNERSPMAIAHLLCKDNLHWISSDVK